MLEEGGGECVKASVRNISACVEPESSEIDFVHSGKSCDEEEELAVLPRHTKVIVTGNNRTKSVLVGLQGVVKKAVGLGGWHWLVLTNGDEVKLQRNALSVLEAPTGLEEDDNDSDEHLSCKSNIEDSKPVKSKSRIHRSSSLSRSGSRNHSREYTSNHSGYLKVDFHKFEMASLQKYLRHFDVVEVGPNSSKEQLVDAVERHFMSQQLDELQVITSFVQAAKRLKPAACR